LSDVDLTETAAERLKDLSARIKDFLASETKRAANKEKKDDRDALAATGNEGADGDGSEIEEVPDPNPSPMEGVSAQWLDSELVRLISNEMQCPICADLLLEPHMVCSNQHNLCQDCLGNLLENRINRCPECREIITSISRNRFACKAVEVLASIKLGTALVEERMERKSGFENRQIDLDGLLAAIPSHSTSDDSSERRFLILQGKLVVSRTKPKRKC
jgi:hypothetical protein